MSSLSYGVNRIVIGQVIPAEILPGGVKIISKKSLIDSFNYNILNELKVKETFVSYTIIV
jgi:hypothetical protein